MLKKNENTLSAYFTLYRFFEANGIDLNAAIAIFSVLFLDFTDIMDLIEKALWEASDDKTGWTLQKKVYRLDATEKVFVAGNAYTSTFLKLKNFSETRQFDRSLSELNAMTDIEFATYCDNLAGKLKDPIAGMEEFNADAAFVALFKASAATNSAFLNSNLEQINRTVVFNGEVDKRFELMSTFLDDTMDRHFKGIRFSHSTLYELYMQNRKRVDNAASHGTPTKTITIPPHSIIMALELVYKGSRSFRVVNQSGEIIFWGLSTLAASFTNVRRALDENSTSNVMSKTLGPDGNYLIFENPSDQEVTVDIWVEE